MITPPVRPDERERLKALQAYEILDSGREAAFDELARAASLALDAEVALVSLVDDDRQWFKATVGLDTRETPRSQSFCAYSVHDQEPLVVLDAEADARFVDNPLVTAGPGIRFYAGSPLMTPEGHALGTLCVIDSTPRTDFSEEQMEILQLLARQGMRLIEGRRVAAHLAESLRQVRELAPMIPVCAWCNRVRDDQDYWSSVQEYLAKHAGTLTSHSICPRCTDQLEDEVTAGGSGDEESRAGEA